MTSTDTNTRGGETLQEALAAMDRGDRAALERLIHEDFVMEWPQSGERFRGRDNALSAVAAAEVKPEPAGEPRLIGDGNVWALQMPLRYGDELVQYLGVFELDSGRLRRATEVFGAAFPAQAGRAQFAER
jgi:hypothetical protein